MKRTISLFLVLITIFIASNLSVSAYYSTDVDPYFEKFHFHDIQEFIVKKPTCTENGLKCTWCASPSPLCDIETEYIEIPATGHDPGPFSGLPPTCIKSGDLGDGSLCYICGVVFEEPTILAPLGHNIVTDAAVPASCTESGLTEGQHCSRCIRKEAIIEQKIIPPTGHNYTRVEQLTCNEYTCENCGDNYTKDKLAGDIDNNEYLSISDVTKIQKITIGIMEQTEFNLIADVSGDGILTIRDATYIQLYLAKLIETFPITQ